MLCFPIGTRLLVTGATGFIGRQIIERALASEVEVHATVYSNSVNVLGVNFHVVNLLSPSAIRTLIKNVKPTHLIHSAWMTVPGKFWTAYENLDWLEAGVILLRAFGEAGGKRFVGIGTCAEYNWSSEIFAEDCVPILPSTIYGKSKAVMASAADLYSSRYGFTSAWGRVFLPFGPGDSRNRLIPSVLQAIINREEIALSSGEQIRDFIFVSDVADLVLTMAQSNTPGIFNIGTGIGTSIRQVVEMIAELTGGSNLLKFNQLEARIGEPQRLIASMQKVSETFGWQPKETLETGIHKTILTFTS